MSISKVNIARKITFRIWIILVSTDILETFTHYCFKKSALPMTGLTITALGDAFFFVRAMVLSPYLWLGLTSVLATFILWSTLLSKIDLSVAVPICSLSYVTVPLVSMIFLGEKITFLRWTGILFIILGIILVSLSSKHDRAEDE